MSWEQWFQDVAGSVINKAADAKYQQPYNIEQLRIQARADNGLGFYEEGQAGVSGALGGLLGMSSGTTVLLIGGALLLVMMVRD